MNATQFILFGNFVSLPSQSTVKRIQALKYIATRKRWQRYVSTQTRIPWTAPAWPSPSSTSMVNMFPIRTPWPPCVWQPRRSTISSGPSAACQSCARPFERNFKIIPNSSIFSYSHTRTRCCPSKRTLFWVLMRAKAARTCSPNCLWN